MPPNPTRSPDVSSTRSRRRSPTGAGRDDPVSDDDESLAPSSCVADGEGRLTRLDVDGIAATIAATQRGVATRIQLRAAGASRRRIQLRVKSGALRPLHRGVYLVGPVLPPGATAMAACLACGPDAVVSHRSAAELWGLVRPGRATEPVDVTVFRSSRRRVGVRIHRSRTLPPSERTELEGVPITTPGRTLIDLATVSTARELEQAIAEAFARRCLTRSRLETLLRRHPGQPGAARVRLVVEGKEPVRTRSEAEERMLALVRAAGAPPPAVNVRLGPYEVDFHWPEVGLVVEVDGYGTHGFRRAFERDRRRDAYLIGRGLRIMRVSWGQLNTEPEAVLFRLGQATATR